MTSQFDFTNNEWADIAALPVLAGYAVAMAEDSGRLGTFREIRALVHAIAAKAPDNEGSAIIEAVTTIDVKDKLEQYEPHAPELLGDIAVRACAEMTKVLAHRASVEAAAGYRRWVLTVATEVALAAKEHGSRVSDPEADLLARLETALGF